MIRSNSRTIVVHLTVVVMLLQLMAFFFLLVECRQQQQHVWEDNSSSCAFASAPAPASSFSVRHRRRCYCSSRRYCPRRSSSSSSCHANNNNDKSSPKTTGTIGRRDLLHQMSILTTTTTTATESGLMVPLVVCLPPLPSVAAATTTPAAAATAATTGGLGQRLAQRDPSLLSNKVFNLPPGPQVYPEWMRNTDWKVNSKFSGYIFPSQKITKQRITQDYNVAGFYKCSIANTADVGKDNVSYNMRIDNKGYEDRMFNYEQSINAYLGYPAVKSVQQQQSPNNPNRISIDFVDYRTINAERIELFCNARESELYKINDTPVFVCAEYWRQVTFGTGTTVGVPRQVVTNYANFWTWVPQTDSKNNGDDDDGAADTMTGRTTTTSYTRLKGNLLTAAYLDPNDPLYFEEPTKPVVVYSHSLTATR